MALLKTGKEIYYDILLVRSDITDTANPYYREPLDIEFIPVRISGRPQGRKSNPPQGVADHIEPQLSDKCKPDTSPDVMIFDVNDSQELNTLVYSSTVTVTGVDAGYPISSHIGGKSSLEYQINGGPWLAVGTFNNVYGGDQIRMRVVTSETYNFDESLYLTVGTTTAYWTVGTKDAPLLNVTSTLSENSSPFLDANTIIRANNVEVIGQWSSGTMNGNFYAGQTIDVIQVYDGGNNGVDAWVGNVKTTLEVYESGVLLASKTFTGDASTPTGELQRITFVAKEGNSYSVNASSVPV